MNQGEGGTPKLNMNNLNQMTNLTMGGVQVPGGMPGMAQQAQQNPNMSNGSNRERSLLNTYIYDYFIRHDMLDSARAILQEAEVSTEAGTAVRRGSPSRRVPKHDSEGNLLNGTDDSMDTDRKEDMEGGERVPDLPLPKVPQDSSGGSFLYDWWSLFWDIFGARTGKTGSGQAMTYVGQVQAKSREQQQRLLQMNQAGLMAGGQIPAQFMAGYPNQMMRVPNGVIHADDVLQQKNLARQAMVNNQRKQPFPPNQAQQQAALQQQLKNQQQHQQLIQQQMQREHSEGERPQSPAPGQNGSSPSKRPRTEGEFQSSNGRGQPQNMPNASQAQTHAMLLQHGINPQTLTPAQFQQFQGSNPGVQAKSIAAYANNLRMHQQNAMGNPALAKGVLPNAQMGVSAAHGTPMMHQTSADGGPGANLNDFYNGGAGMGRGGMNATGNHALQDYQMQLMLLEQQNKKRLMMARAEQDQIHMRGNEPRADGSVPFQSMSPSGTRAAPSPQPSADIKRGTPKMGTQPGPGSPLPDGNMQIQRGSPAAIAGFNGQPALNMRPPSSHPPQFNGAPLMTEQAMRQQAQAGRGQTNMWPSTVQMNPQTAQAAQAAQQQMAQLQAQHQQQQQQQAQQAQQQQAQQQQAHTPQVAPSPAPSAGQPQSIGTPGQARPGAPHQTMPPPSAPAANPTAGRTSPQVNAMPPTPTNKTATARKKEPKENRKQSRPSKKAAGAAAANAGATGATPSEAETPAPDTPITPQNANSFSAQANVGKPQGSFQNPPVPVAGASVPEAVPSAAAPTAQPMAASESSQNPTFTAMDEFGFNIGDTTEPLLTDFDFDSFLNTENTGGDLNFDFSNFAGMGDDSTLGDP